MLGENSNFRTSVENYELLKIRTTRVPSIIIGGFSIVSFRGYIKHEQRPDCSRGLGVNSNFATSTPISVSSRLQQEWGEGR